LAPNDNDNPALPDCREAGSCLFQNPAFWNGPVSHFWFGDPPAVGLFIFPLFSPIGKGECKMIFKRLSAGLLDRLPVSLLTVLCAGFLPVPPLSGATVSFLVLETGLEEGQGASQYSSLYESGLLDVFFDAGHIVSNAPILRLSRVPGQGFPEEAMGDLEEAAEGGMEYFILAQLDYAVPPGEAIEKPRTVFLRIFRVAPRTLIYERRYDGTALPTMDDEFLEVRQRAGNLTRHLNDR
jgi:hypothetical protein